jgi:hypothetical protein
MVMVELIVGKLEVKLIVVAGSVAGFMLNEIISGPGLAFAALIASRNVQSLALQTPSS